MKLYFAYGRNMNKDVMRERGVKFISSRKAVLVGYKLIFNASDHNKPGVGYANIIKDPKSIVVGVLYEIETGLDKLDKYEGVPIEYRRETIEIGANGKVNNMMTYIAVSVSDGLKPEKEYLDNLIKGAKQHDFPDDYIEFLSNVETVKSK